MTESIAWIVSTARHNTPDGLALQLRVLCPLCHLIHTHNANTVSNPGLGNRSAHCGKDAPPTGPTTYDLTWPDDSGARLLLSEMRHCHANFVTSGRPCSRQVHVHLTAGFYCGGHETTSRLNSRMPIDTSSISPAAAESAYTPKFDIVPGSTVTYRQLTTKSVDTGRIARRG